jgi:glycogen synthase
VPGLTHLFLCREYPPAAYPPGGIGTYVRHIADLLASHGDTVHVIAHRWDGAPLVREERMDGRLIVHRVALNDEPGGARATDRLVQGVPDGLLTSSCPAQSFSWQAAFVAEQLVADEGIDVIEAQEWEAPLYYFQLRRALRLGPPRQPPCVVHLHSPSEQIFTANGWDKTITDYAPIAAMEAYCIAAADAVLAPSRYVADQAIARYAIDARDVHVIPYPLGEALPVRRAPEAWSRDTICHVGRLEPRKGVIEWAEAVAMVSAEHAGLRADFVGGDTPLHATGGQGVRHAMLDRVPRDARARFTFHGTRDRAGVGEILGTAFAAVVPSRWENFPYSCIEAMASGLPVVASPHGGMCELIVDGESGWIAADGSPKGLADALRRALATPAATREQMGAVAAATVRRVCDSSAIVARHLHLKGALTAAGASRSAQLPVRTLRDASAPAVADAGADARRGLGVVVTNRPAATPADTRPSACLTSLAAQTVPPAVVTVSDAASDAATAMLTERPNLLGVVFAETRLALEPTYLATCETLFRQNPALGLWCGWTRVIEPRPSVRVQASTDRPHVWFDDVTAPYIAIRTTAWQSVAGSDVAVPGAGDAVSRAGWATVTYPAVFGSIALAPGHPALSLQPARFSLMARGIRRLHASLFDLLMSGSFEERRALVWESVCNPGRAAKWLVSRASRVWRPVESIPELGDVNRVDQSIPHVSRRTR